jgi:hypothetical protein
MARMDQPEQRKELAEGAAPLVHGVEMAGGIGDEAGIEAAQRVAALVERARPAVGMGRQQVPVLGVEDEHQAHQHRKQALVEMAGLAGRQPPHQLGRRGIKPAQQLVQGAQHLLGERGGDGGLGLAALAQQGWQAALAGIAEQPEVVEHQPQPAQHRPAGDRGERADREGEIARGLAARRMDQAELAVADQEAGADSGLAQQALEALLRGRLPAAQGAARIRVDAGRLDPDQELPGLRAVQLSDRPGRLQHGLMRRQRDQEIIWHGRPARAAGHMARLPAEHRLKERPGPRDRAGPAHRPRLTAARRPLRCPPGSAARAPGPAP